MEQKFERSNAVLIAKVGDDVVALDRARGLCFGMADVAADVWDILAEPHAISEVCEIICARYEVEAAQCQSEMAAYFQELLTNQLIQIAGPRG